MYILSKRNRKYYTEMCNRWIKDDLTVEYIKETIRDLAWATSELIVQTEDCDIASEIDILIDDILEMDSISDSEKDEAILELVEMRKKELQALAQRVVDQIEIDRQDYKREAEQRGYCQELSKNLCEDDVLGMDSISEEDEAILKLIEEKDKKEIQALLKEVVEQIEIERRESIREK